MHLPLFLLRGICQMPAYVAHDLGYFTEEGIDVDLTVEATAWLIPDRLLRAQRGFAVIPWTRVAVASARREPLVLVCGSGCEEAAIVVRHGLAPEEVRCVALPQEGGMKDLTAAGLLPDLGWDQVETVRLPTGDAAILCLIGGGADAASMVEPWATMLEELGVGTVVRRTGDLWPGAPGCSLTTTAPLIEREPDLVRSMVAAFVRGAELVTSDPEAAAAIGARYMGVGAEIVCQALARNRPNVHALENEGAMREILELMVRMGYLRQLPSPGFRDLSFLESRRPVACGA